MVVSFHGGSPFQGFVTRFYSESGGTAASTSNYSRDTVQIAAVYQSCESINDRLLQINMLKVSGAPCYTSTDDLSRIPHLANGM